MTTDGCSLKRASFRFPSKGKGCSAFRKKSWKTCSRTCRKSFPGTSVVPWRALSFLRRRTLSVVRVGAAVDRKALCGGHVVLRKGIWKGRQEKDDFAENIVFTCLQPRKAAA